MFKIQNTFSSRVGLSKKILDLYPDRIPLIIIGENISLSKTKFLVPKSLKIHEILQQIRGSVNVIDAHSGLYLHLSNGIIPNNTENLEMMYSTHVDDDGFLYIHVSKENVFG